MKTRFALLITAALLAVGLPIPAHAATPFAYTVSGGNATITGYQGTTPSILVIPDEISDGNGTTYPVTAIGGFAFSGSELTGLNLPDSLTTIGNNAFYGNRLTELNLPDSLTAIGDNAFYLNQLTELNLPDALTTIGNFAFSHNQLTGLDLPDALTTIGNFAFYSNKLTKLTLSHALTTIGNSAFYNNRLTEVAFPDTLTTIGDSAFINNQLVSARFAGEAPSLGVGALGTSNPTVRFPWRFGDPRATNGYTTPQWLGYATIPVADVTFTGGGNIDAQLVDVDGTSTATKPADPVKAGNRFTGWFTDGTTTPFDFATPITGDTVLTAGFEALTAPSLSGPATTSAKLGAEVTWSPVTLTADPAATVTATGLPAGLTIDDSTGVISGKVTDPSLARNHTVTITASNGVKPAATHTLTISIEYFTYSVAAGNATITGYHGTTPTGLVIPDEITDSNGTYPVTAIGGAAFANNELTELTLPNTLTTIESLAFGNNKLTEVTLPDSLTTVGDFAFAYNKLDELTLPSALTTISAYAFGFNQLDELTLPNTLTAIDNFAFAYNKLTAITLPDALTTIGHGSFYDNQLTDLSIPDMVVSIGDNAFQENHVTTVRFTGAAPQLGDDALGTSNPTVRFPWKFDEERTRGGYATPTWEGYSTISVADVTFDRSGATSANPVVQQLDVGALATKPADPIKAGHKFTGWYLADADEPFDFTTPITGDTVLTAGFEALTAPSLSGPATTSAKLGAEVTWEPTTLTADPAATVTATGLPAGLSIDDTTGAISGRVTDPSLARNHTVTITASNGVKPAATHTLTISIEYFTYSVAAGNATITGYHGTTPTGLVIPDEITDSNGTYPVTAIGGAAFDGTNLTELTLPNTVTSIDSTAFQDNQLTELTLPNALTTIGRYAFAYNKLTELTLPNTVTTIDSAAFQNNQLTELTLPNALTTIGRQAFYDNKLAELTLPDTVTTIDSAAFQYNQLTELTLSNTLTTIDRQAFAFNQLTELTLPNTVTTIGGAAFYKNRLTELTLSDALTTIGEDAFHTNLLTEVTLPGTLTTIGNNAIDNNPLATVRFTGAAPQMGVDALGSTAPLPTVRFPWKSGDPRATGGYTTPTWHGYDAIPVADVTFTGGGNIDAQLVDVDGISTAAKPTDPVKAGHVFTGWFADNAAAPFDFATPITGDTALTARFELSPVSPEPGPAPAPDPSPVVTGFDPAITGTVREGKTLRAKPGTITPAGTAVAYQWRANGKAIKGATKSWLPLRKAQAGKRITVTITAKTTGAPAMTKTSAKSKPVSSAKRRLVLLTYRVGKNKPLTVTATGFTARQKVVIWLGGTNRYIGRADTRGVITKTVTFAKDTLPGLRRVRVSGYASDGDRNRTIVTTVRYR